MCKGEVGACCEDRGGDVCVCVCMCEGEMVICVG